MERHSNSPHLTPRGQAVLDLLLEGASEKQVAARLRISANTVHGHVKAIYREFGVSSRPELLVQALTSHSGGGGRELKAAAPSLVRRFAHLLIPSSL